VRLKVKIRPFAEADAAGVRELFIVVNRLLAPRDMQGAFEAYIARALAEEIDRIVDYYGERAGGFWVAIVQGGIAGTFGLERVSADAMELRRMYVAPTMRRRGIARRLLAFAEEECRRRGIRRIELSTSELQPAAVALYRNSGYALVRELVAEEMSNKAVGGGIRRYYFEKQLSSDIVLQ
jgi:GNAT superfamily N-acetyltransferase